MSRKKSNSGLRFQPAGGNRTAQVPVGKKQRLQIERLSGDGRGIAFIEGRTWFVSGALGGEEVEARVLGARGKVVEARLERVFQASPERREAPASTTTAVAAATCSTCPTKASWHSSSACWPSNCNRWPACSRKNGPPR